MKPLFALLAILAIVLVVSLTAWLGPTDLTDAQKRIVACEWLTVERLDAAPGVGPATASSIRDTLCGPALMLLGQ